MTTPRPTPTYDAVAKDLGWKPYPRATVPPHDVFMRRRKQEQWLKKAVATAGLTPRKH